MFLITICLNFWLIMSLEKREEHLENILQSVICSNFTFFALFN